MTEMSATDAILALEDDLAAAVRTVRERTAERDAMRSAAEGLWIAPDGHGTPTIWQMRNRGGMSWVVALLCSSEVNRTIWAVLASVIAERAS
jgi:hypothetical protein